jgi:hypothetical protein
MDRVQINLINILASSEIKIHFNIIFPTRSTYYKLSVLFKFSRICVVYFFLINNEETCQIKNL